MNLPRIGATMVSMSSGEFGRKVFFLYPHSVFEEHLLMDLIKAEFEIYLIKDHVRFFRVLAKHPGSMMFINIDEGMKEPEWEVAIKALREDPDHQDLAIGILSYNDSKELAQKYLMDIGITCGFITLKLGLDQSRSILLRTLEANEARGRRKYIRVICPPGTAEFNVRIQGELYSGSIINLSSVGMAIRFKNGKDLREGTKLEDMQLTLKGARIMITAIAVLKRPLEGVGDVLVMMFEPSTKPEVKDKLYTFIMKTLQAEADRMLGA